MDVGRSVARRIAVINDRAVELEVLCSMLRAGGHEVTGYGNVEEALTGLVRERPDLVVTDLNMPGLDGWDFCRLLRTHSDPELRTIPILAVSATFQQAEVEQVIRESGADGFVCLPVREAKLLEEVARLVGSRHPTLVARVALVTKDEEMGAIWGEALERAGFAVGRCEGLSGAGDAEIVVMDLDPQARQSLHQLGAASHGQPRPGLVTLASDPDPTLAVEAVGAGARLHFRKPMDPRYLAAVVERVQRDSAFERIKATLEQKSASLQDAVRRLRLAVEHANVGLWVWDLESNRLEYSPEWKKQLGYVGDEISDSFTEWECRLHPDDREAAVAYVRRFLESGETAYRQEFRLRHKDGSYRRILSQGSYVFGLGGKPTHLIGTHVDLTEFKRLEEQRIQFERDLLHTQKLESLGVLAGGLAHDFNNLLMAVMGQLELAQLDLDPGSEPGVAIAEALVAVNRASELTRQLLVYSGKARQQMGDLDLNTVVNENLRLFRAAVPKQIAFDLELAPALPRLRADRAQVQQVVMNLITNAAEAISKSSGRVVVRTGHRFFKSEELLASRLGNHPPPGDYVWLEVEDNGCGMDEVTVKRVFDPFFTTKKTGRGLGMSSVLGILRSHRGAILVRTAPDQGTTFTVLFPAEAKPS